VEDPKILDKALAAAVSLGVLPGVEKGGSGFHFSSFLLPLSFVAFYGGAARSLLPKG
jgi:hypothetical protein